MTELYDYLPRLVFLRGTRKLPRLNPPTIKQITVMYHNHTNNKDFTIKLILSITLRASISAYLRLFWVACIVCVAYVCKRCANRLGLTRRLSWAWRHQWRPTLLYLCFIHPKNIKNIFLKIMKKKCIKPQILSLLGIFFNCPKVPVLSALRGPILFYSMNYV